MTSIIDLFLRTSKKDKNSGDNQANSPPIPQTAEYTTKIHDLLDCSSVKLLYWPGYSNPYQRLLYGQSTDRFTAVAADIETAIETLRGGQSDRVVFHLHWLNFLSADLRKWQKMHPESDPAILHEKYRNACAALVKLCADFQNEGGILFWTMHNLFEHSVYDWDAEQALRGRLLDMSDAVFVHAGSAKAKIRDTFGSVADKISVMDHGNYLGVYPDAIAPAEARSRLGLTGVSTIFLNLGFVRAYKGIDSVLQATADLCAGGRDCRLLIAGKVLDDLSGSLISLIAGQDHVLLNDGWVADDDIQIYTNAADFMVLPFRNILISGSAILALSFALPIVAPRLGAMPDLVKDGINGFLYDPDDPDGLRTALQRAADTTLSERANMRCKALETAQQFSWLSARAVLFRAIANSPRGSAQGR